MYNCYYSHWQQPYSPATIQDILKVARINNDTNSWQKAAVELQDYKTGRVLATSDQIIRPGEVWTPRIEAPRGALNNTKLRLAVQREGFRVDPTGGSTWCYDDYYETTPNIRLTEFLKKCPPINEFPSRTPDFGVWPQHP